MADIRRKHGLYLRPRSLLKTANTGDVWEQRIVKQCVNSYVSLASLARLETLRVTGMVYYMYSSMAIPSLSRGHRDRPWHASQIRHATHSAYKANNINIGCPVVPNQVHVSRTCSPRVLLRPTHPHLGIGVVQSGVNIIYIPTRSHDVGARLVKILSVCLSRSR